MTVRSMKPLFLAAGALLLAFAAGPDSALAQCCAPPPPCCRPPTPPPPPSNPCCGSGGHQIKVPGVNVSVSPSVIVNASATAVVNASASGAGNVTVIGGGGGSSFAIGSGPVTVLNGLNVEGVRRERAAYQATRTKIKVIVIRAVCIDDRNVPHAASQVRPERDIDDGYSGELYRCIAGSRLQVTWSDWAGKVDFGGGESMMCAKGEALYYEGGAGLAGGGERAGKMECRPQRPARDCNERSLLRRYGAGVKVIKVVITESYEAYREETIQSAETRSFSMSLDGGVGGVAY